MRPASSARTRGDDPVWPLLVIMAVIGIVLGAIKWLGLPAALENNAEALANSTAFEVIGIGFAIFVFVMMVFVYPMYIRT
jgi:uncharacterized membrane protein YidH (DUF202 family)